MYILKTKGTDRIPEYIQFRNDDFILINHFMAVECEKAIQEYGLEKHMEELTNMIRNMPYGKLKKIDLK